MVTVPIIDDTVPDNGETFKLVLSNVSGAKLADAEAVGTILNTETPILTGFTLVNAETGSDVGAIDDGGVLTLDDPANGSYGLVAAVASDAGVGSVRLALTGAKTVTATDDAAPWSLYGGANGQVQGRGSPGRELHVERDGLCGGRRRRCRARDALGIVQCGGERGGGAGCADGELRGRAGGAWRSGRGGVHLPGAVQPGAAGELQGAARRVLHGDGRCG